jgi:organic radical activating enzyme
MPEIQDTDERPCLHCMIVELIDDFYAEYPVTGGEPNTIDTDEVVTALAKTVAELTCKQEGTVRQQIIENLMREIMDYDAEFRQEDAAGVVGSAARH